MTDLSKVFDSIDHSLLLANAYGYEASHTSLKGALSGLRQFSAAESPLKMMKNAFYFTSKALFVLKVFQFCLDFLVV